MNSSKAEGVAMAGKRYSAACRPWRSMPLR